MHAYFIIGDMGEDTKVRRYEDTVEISCIIYISFALEQVLDLTSQDRSLDASPFRRHPMRYPYTLGLANA